MGIRLIVDVLDNAPDSLTHRERYVLVALAEDARDETRTTWNSVERPAMLRRARVSRSQLYVVLKSLIAKAALERVAAGQKNGTAKYRIPVYAAAVQRPEDRDTDTPSQHPRFRDTDAVQRPGTADSDPADQSPENRDTDPAQCPENRDVSVPESGTPTPQSPSPTTPSYTHEGEPEADLSYGIPADARPLVDEMTRAQINVRWPFKGNDWFPVIALIKKCGIPALVDYAARAVARGVTVDSARFFMRGWSELPPLPEAGTRRPQLRAVSGGWQPYTNPDPSVYENGF
ncbi:hypothetical protein ACFY7C_37270 [Streptomyces sp. NPDC012769]|uniref:hypothetical protein n=1 Tax=Streptomyces sp. NPDC012769 TaxID=3364848 RepID=UPI0036AD1632